MKRTHIILLILVAVAVSVIISSFGDFSTYETFASAAKQPEKAAHVIGFVQKDKAMVYDPKIDPNHFTFYAKDKAGDIHRVIFNGEKPQDIEKSEQIVMKGYIKGDAFYCSGIQMKCPSKYKKNNTSVGDNS
jgi:cytochrome c-type biogenesis protein CcmE